MPVRRALHAGDRTPVWRHSDTIPLAVPNSHRLHSLYPRYLTRAAFPNIHREYVPRLGVSELNGPSVAIWNGYAPWLTCHNRRATCLRHGRATFAPLYARPTCHTWRELWLCGLELARVRFPTTTRLTQYLPPCPNATTAYHVLRRMPPSSYDVRYTTACLPPASPAHNRGLPRFSCLHFCRSAGFFHAADYHYPY